MKSSEGIFVYYRNQLIQLNNEQKRLRYSAAVIGWMRLFVFLLLVAFIWTGITTSPFLFIGAAASIIAFLYLVKKHLQKQFEKELGEQKIKILENEIATLNDEPRLWYNGEKFHDPSSYSYDLDIFGNYSLFHYLNRSATDGGQKKISEWLLSEPNTIETITRNQKSIDEIAQKPDFRTEWQGLSRMLPDKSDIIHQLEEKLNFKNEFLNSYLIKSLLFFGPLSAFSCTFIYYFTGLYQPLMYAIVLNLAIAAFFLSRVNQRQKTIDGLQKIMTAYSRMIDCYLKESWQTDKLKSYAAEINDAKAALSELANISEWFDRRMNVVAGVLFNGYVLYDLHCVIRLEKWKSAHAAETKKWFNIISEIEAMQSLGTFAFNHPEYIYPEIQNDKKIHAGNIAHPLIPSGKNVANDFSISHPEKIVLITGSNMSGKSTFLRTVGLNLVLAHCGLPVNASKMEFCPLHIKTSLRQTDNLHENVSLFHAELLRLKSIRDHLKKGMLTLVLLDEMLRGTNSEDKLVGSRQLIEELLEENIFGLIASHDLELGKLEEKYPGKLRNSCFESVITDNELIFDYKLKKGIARNKNATFLLNKMEIIHTPQIKSV